MESRFRWTRVTVGIPSTRRIAGRGVAARYWSLADDERPPGAPTGVALGVKVYQRKEERDAAVAMQRKWSRLHAAPEVIGTWTAYAIEDDKPLLGERLGYALVTEAIHVYAGGLPDAAWDEERCKAYLLATIPGCGRDLHGGNWGWNDRWHLPQLIDFDPGHCGVRKREKREPARPVRKPRGGDAWEHRSHDGNRMRWDRRWNACDAHKGREFRPDCADCKRREAAHVRRAKRGLRECGSGCGIHFLIA